MSVKILVGNLGAAVRCFDLENLFEDYGTVLRAGIITNQTTGRSTSCGFVEMSSYDCAQAAVAALNGEHLDGRAMTVRHAE